MEIEQPNIQDLTNQTNQDKEWLKKELAEQEKQYDGERLPAMKFEEDKVTEINVDIAKPWERWDDHANNSIKKIIPVLHNGEKKVWWVNVKNPVYRKLVELGINAQEQGHDVFSVKILRIGQMKNTRYRVVE